MGPVGKLLKVIVMEGIMVHGPSDDLILHMLNAQCFTMSPGPKEMEAFRG